MTPFTELTMSLDTFKHSYWDMLRRWRRLTDPIDTVLNPHGMFEGIGRNLPKNAAMLTMVDGGAHDGRTARDYFEHFGRLAVYAFEPNTDMMLELEQNLEGVPGKRYNMALAAAPGEAEMFINRSPMTSSILPRSEYGKLYFDHATQTEQKRKVHTITLDEWFEGARHYGVNHVDILKLDLQGYELEALRGAVNLLDAGVGCIITEVNFVPIYEGSPVFGDVDSFLRNLGYRLFNLYNLATKRCDGQLNGADALYIRDSAAGTLKLRKAA